jgi:hypothetical protein
LGHDVVENKTNDNIRFDHAFMIIGYFISLFQTNLLSKMENQKVGIVTWFYYPNPGTAFQAYALQYFINNLPNFRAEILNLEGSTSDSLQNAANAAINRYYAKHYGFLSIFVRIYLGINSYMYCSFQRKKIVKWPMKALKAEKFTSVSDRYDWIIVGGDQLWNLHINPSFLFSKYLFLDFVKGKRKGAYGPSTGNDVWPEEVKEQVKELLSDFSFIGVREKQAVSMVQELVKVPVHWSLDPTFLLDKNDWAKRARKPQISEDYIFEYCIIKSPLLRKITEELSEMTGLPIIESHGDICKHVPSARKMPHPSADTWLGYLMNAKYVVTDSFHGCAFSINTNKDFYIAVTINGSRIYSILELFGLQNRVLKCVDDIDLSKSIDWDEVNVRLEDRRKETQDWLKSSLMGNV